MSNVKKTPKRDSYAAITAVLKAAQEAGMTIDIEGITFDSLMEFVAHEVELLDNKAVAAKARAAAKKAEGDALREKVYNVLSSDDLMTIADIVDAINDPDVSAAMVTSRLTQLVDLERVVKDSVTVGGDGAKSRKLSAYKLA